MTSIIDLRFVLFFSLSTSFRDIWNMAKVELPSWGYRSDHVGEFDAETSDQSSIAQFALMYIYAASAALVLYLTGYYSWQVSVCSLTSLAWLHWTGNEDLGYYVFQKMIKFPKEYIDTHKFISVCGFQIPLNLDWLSRTRKVWFVPIPSIMGWVLGKDVPGKKFVIFALANLALVIALAYLIKI
jgi:hypothetical protein